MLSEGRHARVDPGQLLERVEAVFEEVDVAQLLRAEHRVLELGEAGRRGGWQVVQLLQGRQAGQQAGQGRQGGCHLQVVDGGGGRTCCRVAAAVQTQY